MLRYRSFGGSYARLSVGFAEQRIRLMPENLGCFCFDCESTLGGSVVRAYRLSWEHPQAAEAWLLLTGRVDNPRQRKPMFHDKEQANHIAEVQRLIHAHTTFGGEDLLLIFDAEMCLVSVVSSGTKAVLWKSCPAESETPAYVQTQRVECN
jgi:hypothetical protein